MGGRVVGSAHKTPRRRVETRGRVGKGRAAAKQARPSPASYAVHEAETVMSGRGRCRLVHPQRVVESSKPGRCLDQNKQNNQGWPVSVSVSNVSRVEGWHKRCSQKVGVSSHITKLPTGPPADNSVPVRTWTLH